MKDLKMKNRTKQVQIRLAPEIHRKLKSALALDDSSLVNFFDEAARAYLLDQLEYKNAIRNIAGGEEHGK